MFRTELPIAPATGQLPRTARVLTAGSCFADSIGSRLVAHKVETLVNPFGTVFQPLALGRLLRAAAGEDVDWQQHVVEARGRWQSYDLHGSIGADSPVELLQHIQELVRRTGDFLRQADVLLLTLGTAWAYRLRETGELVNNCHKQPADLFVRELLTPDEIINNLAETHAYLRRINPNLRFVLTVSPVRHLKDTLPLNSVSKSVLRVATHILSDLLPGVAYFPAYELLVDDLRDYRFYAADMLHPSEVAEDYIWDKFARTYFDAEFGRFRKEWASVQNSLTHRPLHSGAPEHRQFLENTLAKLEQFSLRKVSVDAELQQVRTQLAALPVPRASEPVEVVEDDEERIDIGEGSAPEATPVAEARPPRLSPEEFRAQRAERDTRRHERGRRDGRGKGQPLQPSENEQFQTASASSVEPVEDLIALPTVQPVQLEAAEELLNISSPAQETQPVAGAEEPVKKKKRRSRGGAKRTARKHALRLATGEAAPEASVTDNFEAEAATQVTAAETPAQEAEGDLASPPDIQNPDKQRSRRDKAGRVPRVPLFAPNAPTPETPDATAAVDAEAPAIETSAPAVETAAVIAEAVNPEPVTEPKQPRNNRNRGRKSASNVPADRTAELASGSPIEARQSVPATPDAEQPVTAPEPATAPAAEASPVASDNAPAPVVAPAPARRTNRAKRATTGARAEKPAVDVPVIPVPDKNQVRTQVAAGRMTGSSATLIEPTAEATGSKKKLTPKKASTPKAKAPQAPKEASEPAAPAVDTPAEKPTKAAPKRKTAAKSKPEAPKPTKPAAKAPRKPAKPAE
ncbi:MAG TPA: GSCFA domain-containing protein [Hymenobacter sp.]|jgi:hypothetical protein|uniref:GSCFA domain-containing protein n=1 Tax=Hymenobacter sp. TaxID=1898978 RepID=UPI002ED9A906